MSDRDELEVLTKYDFPAPLDDDTSFALLDYVAQQLHAEYRLEQTVLGIRGNRFATPEEPFRREQRDNNLHATFYFPLDISSEVVTVQFRRDVADRSFTFASLTFDLGIGDNFPIIKPERQDIIRRFRSTLDTYFKYVDIG